MSSSVPEKRPGGSPKVTKKKPRAYQPGQPRFHCDYQSCNASFARMEHLKRHKISHDKSVTFICEFCQRSFARKDIMTRHIRRQHETTEKKRRKLKVEEGEPPTEAEDPNQHQQEYMAQDQKLDQAPMPGRFDYTSPNFSDNTGSPEAAILGNSNQAVSQLLNEDFMNWLFSQSPSGSLPQSDLIYPSPNTMFEGIDMMTEHIPQYFPDPQSKPPDVPQGQHPGLNPQNQHQHQYHQNYQYNYLNQHIYPPQHSQHHQNSSVHLQRDQHRQNQHNSNSHYEQHYHNRPNSTTTNQNNNTAKSPDSTGSLPPLEASFPCSQETCDRIRQTMGYTTQSTPSTELVDKYLTPGFITYAVDLYWSLHIRWPILHRPTFSVNKCPPLLLVSMITISMYLTRDEGAIELAIELHEDMRYKVYKLPEFKNSSAIWVFQTLLLAEIFEKMCSTEEQHDLATRFHDVLIASMRRGPSGSSNDDIIKNADNWQVSGTFTDTENPDWQRFVDHESRKRVAFFAFVVDTQHTFLFNHPPSMFISDLRFRLPCDEALWEAPDAEHWRGVKDEFAPPPHFSTTIGSFLKLDNPTQPQLSPWSMMVILHGLISVGWNMRLRESILPDQETNAEYSGAAGTGSSSSSSTTATPASSSNGNSVATTTGSLKNGGQWAKTIAESYHGWLRHYRLAFIVNGKLPFNHPYLLGILTTYEFAHIILNTNIQEMQNFITLLSQIRAPSENGHGTGSTVKVSAALQSSAESINQWVKSHKATNALTHALDLIDMFLLGENQYDVTKETAFHRTWCLYVAAVTVWIFHYFSTTLRPNYERMASNDLRHYLGRVRAIISKGITANGDDSSGGAGGGNSGSALNVGKELGFSGKTTDDVDFRVLFDRKSINNCEANILLRHVYDLLRPCRWGVSMYPTTSLSFVSY